jgi:hypothetical protein
MVASFGDDSPAPRVADHENRPFLNVYHPVSSANVVGE